MFDSKNESKRDIFDRIMELPILRIFNPFYRKYKEVLLYLLFGGLSFFLNIGLFSFIGYALHVNELLNNVICWIVCVLFQFFTNRTWVFENRENTRAGFYKQLSSFFGGRVFTLIVEELILVVFITWLGFSTFGVKIVAQIFVIVLNYVISKLVVFR